MALLVASLTWPVSAAAASSAPSTSDESAATSWAVRPADADGADRRAWIELSLDPGDVVTESLEVHNLSEQEVTFALSAADGYFTARGRFNMLPSDVVSTGAGTWIRLPATVTVPAGERAVVPFTIQIPSNATPGDHAAGVAASISTTSADGDGSSLGVESRVGFRVMTRVSGQIEPVLDVSGEARYHGSWNPFERGSLEVDVVIGNEGNVRLGADGAVLIAGPLGLGERRVAATLFEDTLPGDTRTARVDVPGVWPLVLLGAQLTIVPTAVEGQDTGPAEFAAVVTDLSAWAVPWSQLLLLLALAGSTLAMVADRRRRRRKLEALLARAKDEGVREALGSSPARADAADLRR